MPGYLGDQSRMVGQGRSTERAKKGTTQRSKAIVFDEKARTEYLSGFENRKKLARLANIEKTKRTEKEQKRNKRRQRRQRITQAVSEVFGKELTTTDGEMQRKEVTTDPLTQRYEDPLQETTVVIEF